MFSGATPSLKKRGAGMNLRELLTRGLPRDLQGPRGQITIYTIGDATDYRPQSVSEWFRKDQITVAAIERILSIPNHNLKLIDFEPFCPELKAVLALQENSKSGEKNED